MLRYETALWSTGVAHVAGVDEAGMSPLAGPVAAAAVIFASGTRIPEVDDSKRLSAEVRERLAPVIRERALAWAVAFAEVDEIDCINIYWAGLAAMRRAIEALAPAAEHLLIDGRRLRDVALPQQSIIKGDTKSLSIAAASILAKTARDARMRAFEDAVSRIRLRPAQGLSRDARTSAHFAAWAPARSTGDRSPSCARFSACRRCRPGRRGRASTRRRRRHRSRQRRSPTRSLEARRRHDRVAQRALTRGAHAATPPHADRTRHRCRGTSARKLRHLAFRPSTTMLIA